MSEVHPLTFRKLDGYGENASTILPFLFFNYSLYSRFIIIYLSMFYGILGMERTLNLKNKPMENEWFGHGLYLNKNYSFLLS